MERFSVAQMVSFLVVCEETILLRVCRIQPLGREGHLGGTGLEMSSLLATRFLHGPLAGCRVYLCCSTNHACWFYEIRE